MVTLPKFNIAPKNGWLEYYFPIRKVTFQGYVKLREGNCWFGGPVVWIPGVPENERDWGSWGPYPDSNPKALNATNQQP